MNRNLWKDIAVVIIVVVIILAFIFSPILCTNN